MKRKATITVETERLVVISGSHAAATMRWCEACQAEVTMFGLDEASALAELSDRAIFQLAETGAVHFAETSEGKALFCVSSLRQQTEARAPRLDCDSLKTSQHRLR
jgi:uncharacterized protein YgbK (DUF1537 family)